MKLKVIVHNAEEGGYWAEVPALPGCVTQAENMDELIINIHEAFEGWLGADIEPSLIGENDKLLELAL
ncbi:MAG TPA: type II toxin-antitoxin system HicB family antitoxin [Parafilimonas sp.]|nr:type II toxin-antitoxin system HicB family antitoxin [Parafilimonas sp.]